MKSARGRGLANLLTIRQAIIRTTNSAYIGSEMGFLTPPPPIFKSNTLIFDQYYNVLCCFVENGPFLFSIQLKSTKDALAKMMAELETVPLKNLDIPVGGLSLGMACIARYSEDSHLYRAIIMSTKQNACQVFYVDYNNTELVAIQDLYEIPQTFLENKMFAIRFSLSGYKDLDPVDESVKAKFKDLVLQKQLRLKVMPLEGPPLVQYCELYDGEVNVLDLLKSWSYQQQLYTNEIVNHESSPSYETIDVETYVPYDYEFSKLPINTPGREEVIICWWMSPHQFFIHQKSRILEFESMMRHMQAFYKEMPTITISPTVGSSVIVRYQEDNVLYRAKIIASNPSLKKYKVLFVDFGNQSMTDESNIWSVEKRFSELPVMANLCSFDKVASNYDHNYIIQEVEKLLKPESILHCEYVRKENDLYYVDLYINDQSLQESLIQAGVISLLEPNITLEMLTGQQVKMYIVSVKDLLNFKITIEGCDLKLLGSYNDIKFIRSNSHLSVEFKTDYEGKDCVADVIDVSKDKILMLQPIIPLFTNDVPKRICDYPILCRAFDVKIIYVHNENILYAHPVAVEPKISQLLDDMFNYYDVGGENFYDIKIGSFCAANSVDGKWYRGKIINITENESIEIYYIDYGRTEIINERNKIKRLNDEFCKSSAFAIGIYLPLKSINDENEAVINEIRTLTSGYELTLQLTERYKNKWIADVSSNGYSIMDVLKYKLLIHGTDIEYVKNLIDNEKSIEIVTYPTNAVTVTDDSFTIANNYKDDDIILHDEIQKQELLQLFQQPIEYIKNLIDDEKSIKIANNYKDDDITLHDEIQEQELLQPLQQPIEGMTAAYLSHCDNPGRFFLQLESTYSELQKLQENLQIVAGSLPPLMSFIDGAMCIAFYSVEQTWYRARIIDSEISVIQFIDYGITDMITDNSYLKEIILARYNTLSS